MTTLIELPPDASGESSTLPDAQRKALWEYWEEQYRCGLIPLANSSLLKHAASVSPPLAFQRGHREAREAERQHRSDKAARAAGHPRGAEKYQRQAVEVYLIWRKANPTLALQDFAAAFGVESKGQAGEPHTLRHKTGYYTVGTLLSDLPGWIKKFAAAGT